MRRTGVIAAWLLAAALATWSPASAQQDRSYRFSGATDTVTERFAIPGSIGAACRQRCGLYLLVLQHGGPSNFTVNLLDAGGAQRALVANRIGAYQGSRIVPIPDGQHVFRVQTAGRWSIEVIGLDDREAHALPYEYGRRGDAGMGAVRLEPGLLRATLSHGGAGNFMVMLYHASGARVGLLANEIGEYRGSAAMRIEDAGVYYLDVQADGAWSIALGQ